MAVEGRGGGFPSLRLVVASLAVDGPGALPTSSFVLTTDRWAVAFLEACTDDTLLKEVRRDMRQLPLRQQGSVVMYKLISENITSHHEEQIKVVKKIVETHKPSDVKGEHIPTYISHMNVALEYLEAADPTKSGRYIPYDVSESILKNLSAGCSQSEFSSTFDTLYKNWKNDGTPTNLDGKDWREQYELIKKIATQKYNDLSMTDADGKNEWTGANGPFAHSDREGVSAESDPAVDMVDSVDRRRSFWSILRADGADLVTFV